MGACSPPRPPLPPPSLCKPPAAIVWMLSWCCITASPFAPDDAALACNPDPARQMKKRALFAEIHMDYVRLKEVQSASLSAKSH